MHIRKFLATAGVAVLTVAGCSSGASPTPAPTAPPTAAPTAAPTEAPTPAPTAEAKTLTVWLMNGSAPDALVAQLNEEFQAANPGVTVNYQVQQWNGIVDKLTTALASDTPPDVIELGNTQTAKFAASGALMDVTANRADLGGGTSADSTSADELWLGGLNDSSIWDGKLLAVPFYAGTRVVIYNKDMFAKAGLDASTITTKDTMIAAAKKLQATYKNVPDYSGMYVAGQNWYMLLSFIWDRGGDIAVNDGGTWKGTLSSPEAQAGIQDYVDYYKAGSTGPKDNDEMNPPEYDVFGSGKAGMFIGNLWEVGSAIAKDPALDGKVGVFPIPSATGAKSAPVFLGGSNLAVAAGSKNQDLALAWVKLMAGDKYQKLMIAAGNIPNSKALAATGISGNANLQVAAGAAAAASKVTPQDPRWASVEAGSNPIKDMLTKILTGQASIADAAKAADDEIGTRMNAPL